MKYIFTYCFILCTTGIFAQGQYQLNIKRIDSVAFPKKLNIKYLHKTIEGLKAEQVNVIRTLRNLGYFTASIDSVIQDSLQSTVYLYIGQSFEIAQLVNGNVKTAYWRKHKSLLKGHISIENLVAFQKKILQEYENHGSAFAQVYLDDVSIDKHGKVHATLFVEENDSILIDKVIVHGDSKTKSTFMQHYLGIKKKQTFNQKVIQQITAKISQLPYITETKSAELYFKPGYVDVHLYISNQKSNQFNLLLGVLPNNNLSNGKKLTISGEGKLHLQNQFGVGESFFAEFRQIKPRTQNIDIEASYPYLLNLPIGMYGAFNLYKNDSIFVDIKPEIGLMYQFNGFNQLKLFYKNKTSNILNADTISIKSTGQLPSILDIRNNQYGVSLALQHLNYVINPRKGFAMHIDAAVGVNKIKVNQSIANLVDFYGQPLREKYDSLNQKKINYTIGFTLSGYIPLRKRSTLLLKNHSAYYIAKNILENEKYRIGGYQNLRGFDEEAIYTPYYSIFTAEFRFLLSKNSFFSTFSDIAIVEDERYGAKHIDVPVSFGLGIALETKAGIFNLSYALGRHLENKIQFRNGKIHFGFVSLF